MTHIWSHRPILCYLQMWALCILDLCDMIRGQGLCGQLRSEWPFLAILSWRVNARLRVEEPEKSHGGATCLTRFKPAFPDYWILSAFSKSFLLSCLELAVRKHRRGCTAGLTPAPPWASLGKCALPGGSLCPLGSNTEKVSLTWHQRTAATPAAPSSQSQWSTPLGFFTSPIPLSQLPFWILPRCPT